jgi:outer membrane protein OmpA-like peptidoglycan-associated protein
LRDRELRDRVEEIRLALQATDLPDRDWQRLRERLDIYREELRYRVAQSEGRDRDRDRDEARDLDEYWDIVGDRRRSEELSRRELRLRIEAVLVLLERGDLSDRRRDRLRVMLRDDREELREWRQARREERRRYLRDEHRPGEFNIIIGGVYADDYYDYYDTEGYYDYPVAEMDDEDLMRHLTAPPREPIEDRYAADELDDHPEIREMMPGVEVDTITFGFNEYQVGPEQIEELERLGLALEEILAEHADEVFAVEGHTDAVGSDAYNQRLSEQRAEAVKEALVEYFVIDPQNLVTIGYGERYLRIPTEEEERENRRVSIRRVTPWLVGEAD